MPSGFDQLPANPAGSLYASGLAVDSNHRLFVSSGYVGVANAKVRYIDDTATTFTQADPSADGHFPVSILGLSTAPDGTVWTGLQGAAILKRAPGGTAWVSASGGLPTPAAQTMSPPAFDSAGNAYLMHNTSAGSTSQMYKLPVGGSTWATFGPMFSTRSLLTPAVTADGSIHVSSLTAGISSLDSAGTAYTVASTSRGPMALGKDGTLYALVGGGAGTKVVSKAPGATTFSDAHQIGVSGSGSTSGQGLCVHPSGDVYVLVYGNNGGLWRRDNTSGTWALVTLNPVPPTTGSVGGIACAANGRIYAVWADRVHRSKP